MPFSDDKIINVVCSGDNTLSATSHAIKEVAEHEADDYFVFVVSDANTGRYDITPEALNKAMTVNPRVNSYAIFIAEKVNYYVIGNTFIYLLKI